MEPCAAILIKAVEATSLDYDIDEGGGAFYGPKIDIKIEDALADNGNVCQSNLI